MATPPEPEEKQVKEDFPFLDVSSLSEDEQIALKQQLRAETERIKIEFSNFTTAIRDSLESRIPLDEIKDTLLSLDAFIDGVGTTVLDPQDVHDIKGAKTVSGVFIILHKYVSFFNYDIIVVLSSQYGTEDDKLKLKDYLRKFEAFCLRNVYEVPSKAYSNSPRPEAANVVIKCAENVVSLQNVRTMKERVAKICHLNCFALQLHTVLKGCVELHFFVSAPIAALVLPEISNSLQGSGGSSAGAGQGGGHFGQMIMVQT